MFFVFLFVFFRLIQFFIILIEVSVFRIVLEIGVIYKEGDISSKIVLKIKKVGVSVQRKVFYGSVFFCIRLGLIVDSIQEKIFLFIDWKERINFLQGFFYRIIFLRDVLQGFFKQKLYMVLFSLCLKLYMNCYDFKVFVIIVCVVVCRYWVVVEYMWSFLKFFFLFLCGIELGFYSNCYYLLSRFAGFGFLFLI